MITRTAFNSVKDWLVSLRLSEYLDTFIKHDFTDMNRVKKLWEVELTSVSWRVDGNVLLASSYTLFIATRMGTVELLSLKIV